MAGTDVSPDSSEHVQPHSMAGYALPTYAYTVPPEIRTGKPGNYRVVVVGGGLTGLTLALDLGLRGVDVVLLDEDDSVGASGLSSRGVVYVHRTLEIFDRLGIADRVVARGVDWSTGRVFKGNEEVYAFHSQPPGHGRLPANVNIQQFFVEEYLVDRIGEVPAIDLRWRNRVTGITQVESGVTLTIETPDGSYAMQADWVVACDGGNSFIRTALGVPTQTHLFDDVWCIADIRTDSAAASERRLWMDARFNAGGVVLNHNLADGVCRFNCQIAHYPDQDEAGTLDAIRRRLDDALDGAAYELVWTGVWRYKRRLTDQFVQGRVIFVGDSAHQVPPFGARGGNSGVADADNLGWKLAMVAAGTADPALIDTYHEERYAAALENISITSRSALFLAPDTPGRRLFRDAVVALAHVLSAIRPMVNTGRIATAQHYPESSLNLRGHWKSPNGPAPGSPSIDGPVRRADGTQCHLSSILDGQFVVIWFLPRGDAGLPEGAEAAERSAGLSDAPKIRRVVVVRERVELQVDAPVEILVDADGTLSAAYGAEAGGTYFLRPDGYVAFRDARLVLPPTLPFILAHEALAA